MLNLNYFLNLLFWHTVKANWCFFDDSILLQFILSSASIELNQWFLTKGEHLPKGVSINSRGLEPLRALPHEKLLNRKEFCPIYIFEVRLVL